MPCVYTHTGHETCALYAYKRECTCVCAKGVYTLGVHMCVPCVCAHIYGTDVHMPHDCAYMEHLYMCMIAGERLCVSYT